jgi:hypothetical protein
VRSSMFAVTIGQWFVVRKVRFPFPAGAVAFAGERIIASTLCITLCSRAESALWTASGRRAAIQDGAAPFRWAVWRGKFAGFERV